MCQQCATMFKTLSMCNKISVGQDFQNNNNIIIIIIIMMNKMSQICALIITMIIITLTQKE